MSNTIDEKVVSMQFDNQQFEKNVSTSMSTIEKLKSSLNFSGASKGLDELNSASKRVDFTTLGNGVEAVRMKFSALQIMGITALQNITNSAVNYGKRIVSALTIDPVKTGLNEYELKMNSVNTIVNSTGESLETVNKYLEELNKYSDQTIYSFQDMTSNIGKFTNAGVKLEDAVSAIKGISNVAAVSGANTNEASRAMYNFSQALSAGYVKLIDWKSIENANMATVEFKNQLIETGLALGTVTKNADGTYKTLKGNTFSATKNFNEVLQDQWMTSEVLVKTLGEYSDETTEIGKKAYAAATEVKTFSQLLDTLKESAQSGWAQTWELLVGDLDQAKKLWTGVSEVIGGIISKSAEARNSLLKGALGSGWDKLLGEGIMDEKGYGNHIKAVAKERGIAIDEMIKQEGSLEKALQKGFKDGTLTSDILSEALGKLTKEYGSLSEEQLKNLGFTKEQVEALTKFNDEVQNGKVSMDDFAKSIAGLSGRELLIESFRNLWKSFMSIITPIKEAFREIFPKTTSEQLYNIIKAIHAFTERLILTEAQSAKLKQTFKGVFAVLDIVVTAIKSFAGAAVKLVGNIFGIGNGILTATSSLGDFITRMRDSIKESNIFAKVANGIVNVIQNVIDAIKRFGSAIKDMLKSSGIDGFFSLMKTIWNFVKNIFKELISMISGTLTGDSAGGLLDILNAGLVTGLIVKLKQLIDSFGGVTEMAKGFLDKIGDSFSGIKELFGSLGDTLKVFQQKLQAEALKSIAIAIGILAAAMLVLSFIDKEKIESALAAMALSLGLLMGAFYGMGKIKGGSLKAIAQLTALVSALLVLSIALKILGTMEWGEIGRALAALGGTLLILSGTLALLNIICKKRTNRRGKAVDQLTEIAKSLVILALGLKILGTMEWEEIGRALTALTGALVILSGTLALLALATKIGGRNKATKQLTKIAGSLVILGVGLKILGTMEWDEIGRALTAMGGALAILSGTLALLALVTKINGGKTATAQLAVMTASLLLLAADLKILATMGWDDIIRALAAMGGAMIILVLAMESLSNMTILTGSGGMLASAAALMVMVGAITALIPALVILGNMKIGTIIQGLITMAATIAIFAGAAHLLSGVIPVMLALGGAITLLGVGVALLGAGLLAMSMSFTTLMAGIVGTGVALSAMVVSLLEGIIGLIPTFVAAIGLAIIELAKVLRDGSPIIGEAIAALLLSALEACVRVIPALANSILQILLGVMDALVNYAPQIVEKLVDLLIGIIESIVAFMPKLIQAAIKVMAEFFNGVVDTLSSMDVGTLVDAIKGIGLLAGLMVALSALAGLVPGAMLGVLGMGAVIAELAIVLAAIGALARIPGLQELIADGGNLLKTIGTAIGQFVGGILGGIAEGFTSSLPAMATDLSNFMSNLQPFINGIKMIDAATLESAKSLASLILVITAANIVNGIAKFLTGGVSMASFASQLVSFGSGIKGFADEVAGIDGETVKAAAEAGKNLGQMAKAIPTSGGLWDLIAGKNDLSGFAGQLSDFGKGVKGFANEVQGVDGETVKSAAEAGKILGDMASDIPTTGGLWNKIKGESNMTKFATEIQTFGKAIGKFSSEAKSITIENVDKGVSAGKKLADMASSLPTSGGLWNAIKGKINMSNFASQLKTFAKGIKDFSKELGDAKDVSAAVNKVKKLTSALEDFSVTGIESLSEPFKKSKTDIPKLVTEIMTKSIDVVEKNTPKFAKAGKSLMSEFMDAIDSYSTKINTLFSSIITKAISTIKSQNNYNKFYSAGKYLVQGVASGISENSSIVSNKARNVAQSALNAINRTLRVASPSKEGIESGKFLDEGLVIGMAKNEGQVYRAGSSTAEQALLGMRYGLRTLNSLIEDGVDVNPTITPVLDLSQIRAGAGAVNGMFNMTPSVGVLAKAGSISSMMNINQNRGNDDVISAIGALKKSLDDNPRNVYNINGITYDDGSQLQAAFETIIREARIEGRR